MCKKDKNQGLTLTKTNHQQMSDMQYFFETGDAIKRDHNTLV